MNLEDVNFNVTPLYDNFHKLPTQVEQLSALIISSFISPSMIFASASINSEVHKERNHI